MRAEYELVYTLIALNLVNTYQAKVDLGVGVGGIRVEPRYPAVESECSRCLSDAVVSSSGRALWGVVELDEDEIEGCSGNSIGQASVRNDALRRA